MKEKTDDICKENGRYILADQILAPIINSFTKWVLDMAKYDGVTRLYFFARDGFLPYEIANKMIKQYDEQYGDIQVNYFVCSRLSLELVYFYATEYNCFPLNIVSNQEIFMSICDLSVQEKIELNKLYEKDSLNIDYFTTILKREAYKQFINFIDYVKEFHMLDDSNFAIVDSGWLGNTQKKIQGILNKAGYKMDVKGFYFGLFDAPKDGGIYRAYYFSPKNHLKRKTYFNPNFFEAISSAESGVALGYSRTEESHIIPVCMNIKKGSEKEKEMLQKIILQSDLIFDEKKIDVLIKKIFFDLDKEMLSLLERICFSMDVSDLRKKPLIEKLTPLKGLSVCIPFRFFVNKKIKSIYWLEGSCSYSFSGLCKRMILLNILLWNTCRFIIKDFLKRW